MGFRFRAAQVRSSTRRSQFPRLPPQLGVLLGIQGNTLAPDAVRCPVSGRYRQAARVACWTLCALALSAAAGCHHATPGNSSDAGRQAPGSGRVVPPSVRRLEPSSSTVGSAPAIAKPAKPAPPDTAFKHFSSKLDRRCTPPADGPTMLDMASQQSATTSCLQDLVFKQARELPERTQAALAVTGKYAWSTAWLRFEQSVCAVEDAESTLSSIRRATGSKRAVDRILCDQGPYTQAAFLLQELGKKTATAFANHVLATAPNGRKRLAATERALRSVRRLRKLAPEDSLFNEQCWDCILADADWGRLELQLSTILDGSQTLGAAVCRSWPKLAKRLGKDCETLLREHFISYLPEDPRPFGQGVTAKTYQGLPPPKDPAYRAVVQPVIDACFKNETFRFAADSEGPSYFACVRKHFSKLASSTPHWQGVEAPWKRFEDTLCQVETDAYHSGYFDHKVLTDRLDRATYGVDLQCRALTTTRAVFVIHSLAQHDSKAFVAHLHARARWLPEVEQGLRKLAKAAKSASCTDPVRLLPKSCRPAGSLTDRQWAKVAQDLTRLRPAAAALGKSLCEAWPALGSGLSHCPTRLRDYFLSYPMFTGLLVVDDNKYY